MPFSGKSSLKFLNPFLDEDAILRVGGRLGKSNLPERSKHQVILPHSCHLTKLIIEHYHVVYLHAGFQLLSSSLGRSFWIIKARSQIKLVIRSCVTCRRHRAATMKQLMGSLPSPRVNPGRVFDHVGLDYAGPFTLQEQTGRGRKQFKGYFCVFVCLAVKAIHLEAVTDLTTEAFIATLKRFISRRGLPSTLYSDCGTNFVGARNELQTFLQSAEHNQQICDSMSSRGIKWLFNPPGAPHQGGLWEAAVKSTKYHLRRVIGQHTLTISEFITLLCQVEACLNSRPLCPISPDPEDFDVLTPGHFIVGGPLTALPEPDVTTVRVNRLSRWEQVQQMLQHFWKRWSAEYLTTLQQRNKWLRKEENVKIGDLVLLHDDQLPASHWKMGRIQDVHPGSDGLVRVVSVKFKNSILKRPITKVVPLLTLE
jgi:Family of unknown function (DUF5641)/Integrase zinc binding domain